jgi:hypothetical protein
MHSCKEPSNVLHHPSNLFLTKTIENPHKDSESGRYFTEKQSKTNGKSVGNSWNMQRQKKGKVQESNSPKGETLNDK